MPLIRPQVVQNLTHLQRAKSLQTAPFTYDLPQDRIANRPLAARDSAKLLIVPRDTCSPPHHALFDSLPALLPRSALLVRNATRVIPARIPVTKHTGGRAEVLLLHPHHHQQRHAAALSAPAHRQSWDVLLGGRNLSVGDVLTAVNRPDADGAQDPIRLEATIERKHATACSVSLTSNPVLPLRTVLSRLGLPPLPPYIRRQADHADWNSFQTVYADEEGSVAAPTAGLHVTPRVMADLQARDIQIADVILHIGTGTFRQVKADVAGDHPMHHESIAVSGHVVSKLASHVRAQRPVIALGTTSIRTIESLYWFGVRLLTDAQALGEDPLSVDQWEPYLQMDKFEGKSLPSPYSALTAVLDWCGGPEGHVHGGTHLLIVPGYRFMITDALITNFHQPKSTLLMLVSAFYGGEPDDLAAVYQQALDNDYRFLSYGDSSIYANSNFFQK